MIRVLLLSPLSSRHMSLLLPLMTKNTLSFQNDYPWHPNRCVAESSSLDPSQCRSMSSSLNKSCVEGGPDTENVDSNNGRIWLHRPFEITPDSTSKVTVKRCPKPNKTPPSSSENKLHNLHLSSSLSTDELLNQIRDSKINFYQSQFQSRVSIEDHKRIQRKTIQSLRNPHKVDVTIYFPPDTSTIDDEDNDLGGNATSTETKLLQGICLHVHGGGWLWGDSHDQVAHRCLEMSQTLKAAVVSVEYGMFSQVRSTDENSASGGDDIRSENSKIFDPVDDVITAMEWIESFGAQKLNARSSFVGSGESSGAHLLLLAMLHRRDEQQSDLQLQPMKSQWKCLNLVYGVFDLSGTPSIRSDGENSSPLCGKELLWLYDLYFRYISKPIDTDVHEKSFDESVSFDRKKSSCSPLYANLSHLPPALLSVGTRDPLLDDTLFMANKYCSYGNEVELAIYEGGEHGIGHFGVQEEEEMGKQARMHTLEFLKQHL